MVLEANHDHWNSQRGPRLERVVFRNDLPPADALELICGGEGEVDIVTEVSPADAQRVIASEHAKLVRVDAMRVLAGIVNWGAEGAPLRRAGAAGLNLAVDRGRLIREVFGGYAAGRADPHYAVGVPAGQQPYQHDPDQARDLLTTAGWPAGRELRLTAPADLEAVARRLAEDFTASLGVEVDLTLIPATSCWPPSTPWSKTPLPFDVLVHAWIDLSSDAPPAFMHSQFFSSMGAFRAGPRSRSSTNCWGGSPSPPTSGS